MFDVRLLQTMIAVADAGSFGRAAEVLLATQPGVSQQIARLEHHLGIRLFNRGTGPVELTTAGTQILARARDILAAVARMEAEAHAWANGHAGALALGLSSSVPASTVLTRIRDFREHQPQYRITVDVASADMLYTRLEAGELDAIVTTLPPHDSAYLDVTVATQPLGVAVQVDHPCANLAAVKIVDLLDERFIVVPREQHAEVYDKLVAAFASAGRTLAVAGAEVAFPSVLARVALGEGVGLVPVDFMTHPSSGAVIIPLDEDFHLPIRYVARRGTANPAATALLAHLRETGVARTVPDDTNVGSKGRGT